MKTFLPAFGRFTPIAQLLRLSKNVSTTTTLQNFALILLIIFSLTAKAQYNPGLPARFGIDGDNLSGENLNGIQKDASSHDWFARDGITALGLLPREDNTLKTQLAAGINVSTYKRMQYPLYSVQDGYLLLDGSYFRDYLALSTSTANMDRTVFVSTNTQDNKNYQDPSTWTTITAGASVPNKVDVVDTYIHMRRDGTSIQTGNPSALILNVGTSMLATDGDRYVDFELFKSVITYNETTGKFTSEGPAATGGRDIWEFNADGSIKSFGSMTFSFAFKSEGVTDIAIYLWVPYATFDKVKPAMFDFDKPAYFGTNPIGGYGYAKIKPKDGKSLLAWGTVNTTSTPGPSWGTNAKASTTSTGAVTTNYYSANYEAGQFAEAAINLTALGVDPSLGIGMDKCKAPFRRAMVKSRSSSSFAAALQDFAGPFEFLDAPTVPAEILPPAILTCSQQTVELAAANPITGATYTWSTTDGNIVGNNHAAAIQVDKPGTYTLTASAYEGCFPNTTTTVVLQDITQPVASAKTIGILTGSPTGLATLQGEATSSATTPFGPSQGFDWNWNGPLGFTASTQNTTTAIPGEYVLTVTEKRNGCSATALTLVELIEPISLPIVLEDFSGALQNEQALLTWKVSANETGDRFEVQRSADSRNFKTVGHVFTTGQEGREQYQYKEVLPTTRAYYRLLVLNKDGSSSYSKTLLISKSESTTDKLILIQNPVTALLQFQLPLTADGLYTAHIYTAGGVKISATQFSLTKGMHTLSISLNHQLPAGAYLLEVSSTAERKTAWFIKQ